MNKLITDEKGQVLILVLILMVVGGLIIAPLLSYMSTGLKVGKEVFEERMYGQYAADAGVEDALYKIKVDDPALPDEWEDVWDQDIYNTSHTYSISDVNDNDVDVTIQPYWILTGLEDPHEGMLPHAEMVVVSNITGTDPDTGNGVYQISISYDMSKGQLFIMGIGAWLPVGYEYVPGSSNLEADDDADYYCMPVTEDLRGGKVIKWNYSSPYVKFQNFPGGSTGKVAVTFQFTPAGNPASAFTWVREKRGDVYLSWDVGVKVYQINSEATSTIFPDKTVTVEAYAAKNETPGMGSAMSGDYVAMGSSLMMSDPNNNPSYPNQDWRSRLLKESSATIPSGSISAGATIERVYLYWSGFIDHYYWYQLKSTNEWQWSDDPNNWSVPQDNATGLVYPNNPTLHKLTDLVETAAKVNIVSFGGGGVQQDITTHTWAVWPKTNDSPACWYYTCFYDATDIVKPLIESGVTTFTLGYASTVVAPPNSNLRPGFDGASSGQKKNITYKFDLLDSSGSYTVGYTGYPLGTPAHKLPYPPGESNYGVRYHASYAGWSLIVIYSSPETKGHQLYLYDIRNPKFIFKESFPEGASESNPDFDGDSNPGGRISGFLVPTPIEDEVNAAHMTCFIGEGDEGKTGDSFKVTGPSENWAYLLDGVTGTVWNDVWNSKSVGLTAPGVDIDTFYVTWESGILNPGDTWAQVDIPTVGDGFTLSYIILSFRSEIKTSGTMSYMYVGGG